MTALGCGPRVDVAPSGETTGTTSDAATESAGTTSSTTSTSTTTSSTTTDTSSDGDGSSDDDSEGRTFITRNPDGGGSSIDCDIWAQNCPRGEKCTSWSHDDSDSWNATRCVPIDVDPKGLGEACTVVDSWTSGLDDCEMGAMCWDVDPETNIGECVAMCHGNAMNPLCTDPCEGCRSMNDGVLILCLPSCDPIVNDCGETKACYPTNGGFACLPDVQSIAEVGDPCLWHSDCGATNFCALPEQVPGCAGEVGCCARFCDVEATNDCQWLDGTSCVRWFDEGRGPAKSCGTTTEIGACIVTV